MTQWIERWYGSGPDRGWSIWEVGHGDRIAYVGEGDHSERLTSLIVQKHNEALTAAPPAVPLQGQAQGVEALPFTIIGDILHDKPGPGCRAATTAEIAMWQRLAGQAQAAPAADQRIDKINAASKLAMEKLAAIVNMGSREFKGHPGCDYISRDAVMSMIPALRDSIGHISTEARAMWRELRASPTVATGQAPALPDMSPDSRAMLLNVLWHHQGGSSPVGQPLRKLLGIEQFAHMTAEEVSEAKRIDKLLADGYRATHPRAATPPASELSDSKIMELWEDTDRLDADAGMARTYNRVLAFARSLLAGGRAAGGGEDAKDAARFRYIMDCEIAAASKYLPNLDGPGLLAKRRAAIDSAMQATQSDADGGGR